MIYNKGTLSINNGSPTANGTGTLWSSRASKGDMLFIDGSDVAYYVAAVVSDTQLKLSKAYSGASKTDVSYVLIDDFTKNYSFPYPSTVDVERATILNRSVTLLDDISESISLRVTDVEYPALHPLNMAATPAIDTVLMEQVGQAPFFVPEVNVVPRIDSLIFSPIVPPGVITADSAVVTADSAVTSADGAVASIGVGMYFDNPQGITGIRLGSPLVFDVEPEDGLGLRFINPVTATGIILGSPIEDVTEPVPVQAPTITNAYATGTTTAIVNYVDNQPVPADSFNVIVILNGTEVQNNSTTENPYLLTGLSENSTYNIVMTATAGALTSPTSNSRSFTTDEGGQTGTFVPMKLLEMEGTVGEHIGGDDFMWNSFNTKYSQDQVRFGSTSARAFIEYLSDGGGGWGGGLSPTILQEGRIGEGDELWANMWLWVPTDFVSPGINLIDRGDVAPGTDYGCSELMKWMRWRKNRKSDPTDPRGYIDLLVGNGKYRMASEHSDAGGLDAYVRDQYEWTTGSWQQWEWYVKLSTNADGIMRLWNNGILIAEDLSARQLVYSDEFVSDFLLFTYFNCWAPKDQWLYIDRLVLATSESPPTNQDASGNYMIGTYVEAPPVSDFDFYDNFETGDLSLTGGGMSWFGQAANGGGTNDNGAVPTVTGDNPENGLYSLEYNFGHDNVPGTPEASWSEVSTWLGFIHEFWLSMDIYFPSNFVMRQISPVADSHNKFLSFYGGTYAGDTRGLKLTCELYTVSDGSGALSVNPYRETANPGAKWATDAWRGVEMTDDPATLPLIFENGVDEGTWVNVRFHVKAASGYSSNDGVLEIWKNNVQLMSKNDIGNFYSDVDDNAWRAVKVLGWANTGFADPNDTLIHIDNFEVSSSPIVPVPSGIIYSDNFEAGDFRHPQVNDLGIYGQNMFHENEQDGAYTDNPASGSYSLRFVPDVYPPSTNINAGNFEFYWPTYLSDFYISYDAWLDSNWQLNSGHQKLLAIWTNVYSGGDFEPPTGEPIVVFEAHSELNPSMVVTYQTSADTSINRQQRNNTGIDDAGLTDPSKRAVYGAASDKGKWIRLTWHIKYSQDPGELGMFELWKDSVHVMRQNVDNHLDRVPTHGYRKLYIFGNADSGLVTSSNATKYIDNLVISTTSPFA